MGTFKSLGHDETKPITNKHYNPEPEIFAIVSLEWMAFSFLLILSLCLTVFAAIWLFSKFKPRSFQLGSTKHKGVRKKDISQPLNPVLTGRNPMGVAYDSTQPGTPPILYDPSRPQTPPIPTKSPLRSQVATNGVNAINTKGKAAQEQDDEGIGQAGPSNTQPKRGDFSNSRNGETRNEKTLKFEFEPVDDTAQRKAKMREASESSVSVYSQEEHPNPRPPINFHCDCCQYKVKNWRPI